MHIFENTQLNTAQAPLLSDLDDLDDLFRVKDSIKDILSELNILI